MRRTRPAVVLVRPQEEGNVGAAARAMANMGLGELVLVEPAPALGTTARAFAVGAGAVLDGARRAGSLAEALAPYRRVVGTTSARSRELPATPIGPRELPALLAADPPGTPAALVFGPEASGLTNDELARCSPLVRVPCAPRQPTLNLAQAVLLLAWELRAAAGVAPAAAPGEPPATAGEVEALFEQALPVLKTAGFERDDSFQSVVRDLRRLAARAGPTSREVTILRGLFRRLGHALARGGARRGGDVGSGPGGGPGGGST